MKLVLKIFGIVVVALAVGAPGGEPPPEPADCSPGYWKNHTEVWEGVACTGSDCTDLLDDLKAKGKGSGAIRHAASGYLNSWAAGLGILACTID